jgi:serine/threonine protein kinase
VFFLFFLFKKNAAHQVAIKRINGQYDNTTLQEFEGEVAVMSDLRHPNVLLFIGVCLAPGKLLMVTELMKLGSVKDIIASGRPLSPVTRWGFLRDCALGMAYLHGRHPHPCLHLDLKTANLLVNEHLDVCVSDFGMSQMRSKAEGRVGSPLYMAPEMLLSRPYGVKADVYSFAIVLWEVAVGDGRPIYGSQLQSVDQVVEYVGRRGMRPEMLPDIDEARRSTGQFAPPSAVPADLMTLARASWHPDPDSRPSFGDMVGDQKKRSRRAVGRPTIFAKISAASAISDQHTGMRDMWVSHFGDTVKVSFEEFVEVFYKTLSLRHPKSLKDDMHCQLLRLMLVPPSMPAMASADEVGLEQFGHMLEWLRPVLAGIGTKFQSRIAELAKTTGFHGFVDQDSAVKAMGGKKDGAYLIRFSTSNPGAFAITFVQSKCVGHVRVDSLPAGGYAIGSFHAASLQGVVRDWAKATMTKPSKPRPIDGGRFQDVVKFFRRQLEVEDKYITPGAARPR